MSHHTPVSSSSLFRLHTPYINNRSGLGRCNRSLFNRSVWLNWSFCFQTRVWFFAVNPSFFTECLSVSFDGRYRLRFIHLFLLLFFFLLLCLFNRLPTCWFVEQIWDQSFLAAAPNRRRLGRLVSLWVRKANVFLRYGYMISSSSSFLAFFLPGWRHRSKLVLRMFFFRLA